MVELKNYLALIYIYVFKMKNSINSYFVRYHNIIIIVKTKKYMINISSVQEKLMATSVYSISSGYGRLSISIGYQTYYSIVDFMRVVSVYV